MRGSLHALAPEKSGMITQVCRGLYTWVAMLILYRRFVRFLVFWGRACIYLGTYSI